MEFLPETEQTNWIDRVYRVYKTFHDGEWTEYSPKFLHLCDAHHWRQTKGEQLCDRFGRKLKLFNCRPADNPTSWPLEWEQNGAVVLKRVPGEDFEDAISHVELFEPGAKNIKLHLEKPE